jgi:hypothetical protein
MAATGRASLGNRPMILRIAVAKCAVGNYPIPATKHGEFTGNDSAISENNI